MGRRCIKKITVNGVITLHQRYIYRGYLQIACVDLARSGHPGLWLITWDPAQPTATRPLAIQKNGTWYTCGHDLTKNVTELYNTNGTIATACDYTPFGQVTATGTAEQPIQWSSEFNDEELGLIYYNYRHYNPADGRWINKDPIFENGGWNLYAFIRNNPIDFYDILGNDHTKLNKFKVEKVPGRTIAPRLGAGFPSKSAMSIELTSLPFCCKVSPSGGPTFLIKMTQEEEAYKRAGVTYDFVKQHEIQHYSDFKKNINAYIDLVNSFSGISGKDCTDLKNYFAAADKYYMAQFDYLSVKLDAKDYKEPLKSKKEQELPAAKTKRDEAKKEFDKLKKKIES